MLHGLVKVATLMVRMKTFSTNVMCCVAADVATISAKGDARSYDRRSQLVVRRVSSEPIRIEEQRNSDVVMASYPVRKDLVVSPS